jgi:hypothetical protein
MCAPTAARTGAINKAAIRSRPSGKMTIEVTNERWSIHYKALGPGDRALRPSVAAVLIGRAGKLCASHNARKRPSRRSLSDDQSPDSTTVPPSMT